MLRQRIVAEPRPVTVRSYGSTGRNDGFGHALSRQNYQSEAASDDFACQHYNRRERRVESQRAVRTGSVAAYKSMSSTMTCWWRQRSCWSPALAPLASNTKALSDKAVRTSRVSASDQRSARWVWPRVGTSLCDSPLQPAVVRRCQNADGCSRFHGGQAFRGRPSRISARR